MKKILAMIFGGTGVMMASVSENACSVGWLDEPKMPKSMIER